MNKVGKFGEDIACLFLKKHGYKIIDRNYLKKWGELDVVVKKARKLCFIEVKTISCKLLNSQNSFVSDTNRIVSDETDQEVTHVTAEGLNYDTYRPEDNMSQNKIRKFKKIIQTYLEDKKVKSEWTAGLIAIRVDTTKKLAKVRFIDNLVLQ